MTRSITRGHISGPLIAESPGRAAAEMQIRDLHRQLTLKEELLTELRQELNDSLNEVALLTRIRSEEKRISNERFMQLCSAENQLETALRDLNAARAELRLSSKHSEVSRNTSSELMNDLNQRINAQKAIHAQELRHTARSITVLEEELRQTNAKWSTEAHSLQEQLAILVQDRDILVGKLKKAMLESEELRRHGEDAIQESMNARRDLDNMSKELKTCRSDLKSALKRASLAETEVKELQSRITTLQQRHADSAAEAGFYRVSFGTTQVEHENFKRAVERLQGELAMSDEELQRARNQASHNSIELVRCQNELRRMSSEIEHLSGLVELYRRGGMRTRK